MTDHEKIQDMIRKKEQAPIAIDPARCALVIVDVQRFFTRPDSAFAQVFQKMAPGATDGYFQRVSTGLPTSKNCSSVFVLIACQSSSVFLAPTWRMGRICPADWRTLTSSVSSCLAAALIRQ